MRRLLLITGLAVAATTFTIAAAPQKSEWKPLFNGKDLTGWKHVGPGGDTVEDGLIKTRGGMGLLYWTGGKVGNCRIRVVFKMRDTIIIPKLQTKTITTLPARSTRSPSR